MRITNLPSGALQANTYLAVDEKTNEGFIVDPGGYCKELTEDAKNLGLDILYIMVIPTTSAASTSTRLNFLTPRSSHTRTRKPCWKIRT